MLSTRIGLFCLGCAGIASLPMVGCHARDADAGLPGRQASLALEPCDKVKTYRLRYQGRGMELVDRLKGQARLDAVANRSAKGGKRILLDSLEVTLDLSREQWQSVFAPWFCAVNHLPQSRVFYAMPVRIGKTSGWEYTLVTAGESSELQSRYWRVYLIPQGRTALALRSVGWESRDAPHFNRILDSLASDIDIK